jgi:pimeloyl-ACP methyl ester carboxylesterase
MAAHQGQERFAQAPVCSSDLAEHLTNAQEEEWQGRLRALQGCICELLIKNEQLRELLASVTNQQHQGDSPMNTIKTSECVDQNRRRFLGNAAMTVAVAQLGIFGSANAQSAATGATSVPTTKPGTNMSFAPLKQIDAGLLNVGYAEAGPADGTAVILLHGWPYDIYSFVDVAPLLTSAGYRVIVPYLRGYGTTRFLSSATMRNGQQSVVALDIIALMDELKIQKAIVGGFDWGARTADIIAALWPERCKALVSVSGYLIGSPSGNKAPLPPKAELAWWYQFYFATEIGRSGYAKYLNNFNKLIWQTASPKWNFDDATFDRSAAAFNNPDHVDIVIHNYRWRIGLADGERKYDDLERRLAATPVITVPTITMEGDSNGAAHPDSAAYRDKFSGKYEYRLISGGVGHNLPQEAPQAFAQAIIDVDALTRS